jgi:hypothetical protein
MGSAAMALRMAAYRFHCPVSVLRLTSICNSPPTLARSRLFHCSAGMMISGALLRISIGAPPAA